MSFNGIVFIIQNVIDQLSALKEAVSDMKQQKEAENKQKSTESGFVEELLCSFYLFTNLINKCYYNYCLFIFCINIF